MERIGEYLVQRLLGEGGMGKVYEAEERLTRRRVALKVLRPELARSEDGRRLFVGEMGILASLDHPNVVRCLACTEVEGQLVMALELLDGRTLRQVLAEDGAFGWQDAVAIAAQIASALAAAHGAERPIVHRDLKPENVMMLRDGSVKVMDFGIAKVVQEISRTTTQSLGTLQYMSPEQIDAAPIDARSDLYSLGLVFYELLAGRPPFESVSPRELLNLQCTAPPPPLPDDVRRSLPKGIEGLIMELLAKRPDDRPSTAEDVLHELEPFVPAGGPGVSSRKKPNDAAESAARSAPDRPADSPPRAAAKRAAASPARRAADAGARPDDTIALVEQATLPREVPPRRAAAIVIALSLVAGVVTWWIKQHGAPSAEQPAPSAFESYERRP